MTKHPFFDCTAYENFLDRLIGPAARARLFAEAVDEVIRKLRNAQLSSLQQVCCQYARETAEEACAHCKDADLWRITGDDLWHAHPQVISDALKAVTANRRARRDALDAAAATYIETFDRIRHKRLATPEARAVREETVPPEAVFPDMKEGESVWAYMNRKEEGGAS
jgi:histone H3/H4